MKSLDSFAWLSDLPSGGQQNADSYCLDAPQTSQHRQNRLDLLCVEMEAIPNMDFLQITHEIRALKYHLCLQLWITLWYCPFQIKFLLRNLWFT